MPAGRARPSLMDDAEFLAVLEQLERAGGLPRATTQAFDARVRTLDAGLSHLENDDAIGEAATSEWTPRHGTYGEPEPEVREAPSRARAALAIGGFLLLMGVGAAAAAFVFHDRVAQILSK